VTKIEGIFTPTVVPLDEQGKINEGELRRYIDWLIDNGIYGLYPNGSSGEFTRFTVEERRRITKITIEQAAGRVPVLAGAAEANIRETLAACETYCEYGATAVAIVSPFYYSLGPESVYENFKEIAINSPIDVTLYNIPMFASPIDVPTIQRLAEFDRVIGIKDSSGDISSMASMIHAVRPNRPDFVFLCGWEPALVPMLLMGCNGGTNALSGIVPDYFRRLYEATRAGDFPTAQQMQFDLLGFFEAIINPFEFPMGLRAAIAQRGFKIGNSRQTMGEEQQARTEKIFDTMAPHLTSMGYNNLEEFRRP